jgi:hypothetical protein
MKWLRTIVLFDKGGVMDSEDWRAVHDSYVRSIQSIDFPVGSGKLKLREKHRRPDGQWERNGVKYLRTRFLEHMTYVEGWRDEESFDLEDVATAPECTLYPSMESYTEPITSGFGDFDFVTSTGDGKLVAIEWETGNISSSHRSMNKLCIALSSGSVQAGVLIVPTRALYDHLTDRVGNINELSGYLGAWHNVGEGVESGLLAITVVEHDELTTDENYPYLPSGLDGRAREGASRRVD